MAVMKYYMSDRTAKRGHVEYTEGEWFALMGNDITRPYATAVYQEEMAMDDVPEDIREAVAAVVEEKVKRWGLYAERELSADEALNILSGGDENEKG